VYDGSTSGRTAGAVRAAINPHVRVAGYDRNQGKGFAIKKNGMKCVMGDVVVFSDAEVKLDLIKEWPENGILPINEGV